MSALSDLDQVLASLNPTPEGLYVFACVDEVPASLHPFAQIREAEGITVIATFEDA